MLDLLVLGDSDTALKIGNAYAFGNDFKRAREWWERALRYANPDKKENMELENPTTTELTKAGSRRGQWEPYAVMVPKVTLKLKKICETAVLHTSGFSVNTAMSHSPMYSRMPSSAPSRVTPRIKKTSNSTIGNPMLKYAILPVHFIPKARHNQTTNHTSSE